MKTWMMAMAAVAASLVAINVMAAGGASAWTTDLKQAQAMSKKTGKPILADFTGSDWCGYCMKLHEEVFSKPEFQKWAAQNVVLLTVDFPKSKTLPPALKKQNDELKSKFQPHGYPTIIVMDGDLKELGRTVGYTPGSGFTAWKAKIEGFLPKSKSN
jgi:thioredoxin-related protein